MKTSLLLSLLALLACGNDGPAADAGEHLADARSADAGPSCRALQDEFATQVALVGHTCETIMDCTIAGGQLEQSCDGVPYLGSCSGIAINKLAYRSSRAAAIEAEFAASCAQATCNELQCVADCAPAQDLRCEGHVCVADSPSCLLPPPDAGVPDGTPGDAAAAAP